jgi:hypothetical protein
LGIVGMKNVGKDKALPPGRTYANSIGKHGTIFPVFSPCILLINPYNDDKSVKELWLYFTYSIKFGG